MLLLYDQRALSCFRVFSCVWDVCSRENSVDMFTGRRMRMTEGSDFGAVIVRQFFRVDLFPYCAMLMLMNVDDRPRQFAGATRITRN